MFSSPAMRRMTLFALSAVLAGCSSADPVAYKGIASSSSLQPDPKDETGRIPYRYATAVDWQSYRQVIIDPVAVYRGPDNQFGDLSDADKAELAHYMQTQFAEKLSPRFQIVNTPDPGTLRLKLTLTGAAATAAVIGPFSHFDFAGNLYNGVQAIRGREGMISGAVFYAVEIYDAPSARLLGAYISKQYPGALNIGASFGSLGAAKTGIEKGADALAAQLK